MKKQAFLISLLSVVALLSISVIAVITHLNSSALQESSSNLPEHASPPASTDSFERPNSPDAFSPTAEWGAGEIYDGSAPIIRKMGEELRINALPHRKQNEKPPMSTEVFALWQGEMSFTVTSAELFDSIEETGLNYDEFIDEYEAYGDTYKPLVINLTVKNINAHSTLNQNIFYSNDYMLSSKEEFSPEKFRSHADGEWRIASGMPLVYADPHSNGAYDYFHYTLDEGETINFTLCYYAKTDDIPLNELYLEIATDSDDHRFGFTLDQLKGAE